MIALDRIVTFAKPAGFRITRDLGTIRAEVSVRRGILASAARMFAVILGIVPPEIVTDAERARGRCLQRLRERADALGATGIIAVGFEASVRTDGATVVRATGTAVILEADAP